MRETRETDPFLLVFGNGGDGLILELKLDLRGRVVMGIFVENRSISEENEIWSRQYESKKAQRNIVPLYYQRNKPTESGWSTNLSAREESSLPDAEKLKKGEEKGRKERRRRGGAESNYPG